MGRMVVLSHCLLCPPKKYFVVSFLTPDRILSPADKMWLQLYKSSSVWQHQIHWMPQTAGLAVPTSLEGSEELLGSSFRHPPLHLTQLEYDAEPQRILCHKGGGCFI